MKATASPFEVGLLVGTGSLDAPGSIAEIVVTKEVSQELLSGKHGAGVKQGP